MDFHACDIGKIAIPAEFIDFELMTVRSTGIVLSLKNFCVFQVLRINNNSSLKKAYISFTYLLSVTLLFMQFQYAVN